MKTMPKPNIIHYVVDIEKEREFRIEHESLIQSIQERATISRYDNDMIRINVGVLAINGVRISAIKSCEIRRMD